MAQSNNRRQQRQPASSAPQNDSFGRLQPQAPELEKAILGALLIEQEAYMQVSEILKPTSFYEKRHQIIYEAIQRLNFEEKPVDILTVTTQLESTGQLEDAGGPFYLAELSQMVYSSAHIEFHARVVADKAMARQLITITSEIQTKAFDPTQPADELMQDMEGKVFELSQTQQKRDVIQIDSVINEAYDMLQKAAQRTDGMSGIPSGFHRLDKMTSGWQPSDLVILAARPAMGKTAFSLSMAKNMAVDQRVPVAFFSLEMSKVQLVNRLISNVCEVTGEKLRSGKLAPYEWEQLDSNIKRLYGAPLFIDDTPSLSVFELRTKARRLKREHDIQVIMIDYLQLMNATGMSFNSRQEEVSTISRSLKGLAKELNIPILALSQLNRGVESREGDDKRPQLSDLRESGAIEQDADIVTFIHRPEYYHIYQDAQGHDLRGRAEIIIAKHRNGSVGDVLLNFKGQYVRFENIEEGGAAPLPGETTVQASSPLPSDPFDIPVPTGIPMPDNSDPFASLPPEAAF